MGCTIQSLIAQGIEIKGTVCNTTNQPIEFANIVLQTEDSTFVNGVTSNENGEFARVVDVLQSKNVKIIGIHLHTSSKSRGLDIYKAIAEIACRVKKEFNIDIEYIDVGGGFFGGLTNKPQFEEYMALMADILSTCCNHIICGFL